MHAVAVCRSVRAEWPPSLTLQVRLPPSPSPSTSVSRLIVDGAHDCLQQHQHYEKESWPTSRNAAHMCSGCIVSDVGAGLDRSSTSCVQHRALSLAKNRVDIPTFPIGSCPTSYVASWPAGACMLAFCELLSPRDSVYHFAYTQTKMFDRDRLGKP